MYHWQQGGQDDPTPTKIEGEIAPNVIDASCASSEPGEIPYQHSCSNMSRFRFY